VQFECQTRQNCAAGEVCCASIPLDQAIDWSAFSPEGGLVALGVSSTSFCSGSCVSPHFSLCTTSADCAGGATCDMLPEGLAILIALGNEALPVCASVDGGMDGAPESDSPVGDASDALSDR
jgi:hypothetical protein